MSFGYPVSLEVADRKAVVIGAFAVSERKADALLAAGAVVTVVATGPSAHLTRLEEAGARVLRREYRNADLAGAFLCVASSDDPGIRASIYAEGRAHGVLVNVMDDPPHCDFAAPAVVRRGELTIAVSTGGTSPALARRLREELEERFGPEWEAIAAVVGGVRQETLRLLPDLADRARRWHRALDLDELQELVAEGRSDEARRGLRQRVLEGLET